MWLAGQNPAKHWCPGLACFDENKLSISIGVEVWLVAFNQLTIGLLVFLSGPMDENSVSVYRCGLLGEIELSIGVEVWLAG